MEDKRLTPFGIALRYIRGKYNISACEMSNALGISRAYLSAIELGKRPIPPKFESAIMQNLVLKKEDERMLRKAIVDTYEQISIDASRLNDKQKRILCHIAENRLTKEQTNRILKIIEE